MFQFRKVRPEDLSQIIKIENQGFSKEEAATAKALEERINIINDTFIVAEIENEIAGYINGPVINQLYITDDLFETITANQKRDGYLSILGLAVANKYQKQGLAKLLLQEFEKVAKNKS